jgi:hypothetical protein
VEYGGHILTVRQEFGWTARWYGKTSERHSKRSRRERRGTRGARPGTKRAWLTLSFRPCERGVPSVIFRRRWGVGALGRWDRTFVCFPRGRKKGIWERVATALAGDADMESLFLDPTNVRAQPHSAGAKKGHSKPLRKGIAIPLGVPQG